MTRENLEKHYQETLQDYQRVSHYSYICSVIRFISLLMFVVLLLMGYFQKHYYLYPIAFLWIFFFVGVVIYHHKIKAKESLCQALLQVYQQHIQRRDGQWKMFSQTGQEFIQEESYQVKDLDILGKNSLFQMINIAFSYKGQEKFVQFLTQDITRDELLKRQEAVRELSQKEDFVYHMEMYGQFIQDKQTSSSFYETYQHTMKSISPFLFVFTFMTFLGLLGVICHIAYPYSRVCLEVGIVIQLCLVFIMKHKHDILFQDVCLWNCNLQSYQKIFVYISQQEFHSSLLKELQSRICFEYHAVEGIHKLSRLSQRINYRQNIFAYIMFNALFMFDFVMRNQYINWLLQYGKTIHLWFDDLAYIEALMSLSVLSLDEFSHTMPDIVDTQQPTLSFTQLKHPLIPLEKSVGNSLTMEHQVCVITGSNMSGKTTFMRTIALNLVLAYAGGYVFAEMMTCSLMHILTSMRIQDNVEEGISTFYGEILRIKQMIEYGKHHLPMICFIDEIFKGTNSLDRIAGAKATLQKLSQPYMFTFLTTHDVELCRVDDITFSNYHFCESYQDNHIYFDYRIQKGPSQSTNGQFLLKQLGIIDN